MSRYDLVPSPSLVSIGVAGDSKNLSLHSQTIVIGIKNRGLDHSPRGRLGEVAFDQSPLFFAACPKCGKPGIVKRDGRRRCPRCGPLPSQGEQK